MHSIDDHDDAGKPRRVDENPKIPVIREHLTVSTERIETGQVLISKEIMEEETSVNVAVSREEVLIERKEINEYVQTPPPAVRQEGDVTIISVVKEVLVTEKRLMLVEEVHITKRLYQDEKAVTETLRTEKVNISRNASGTNI
ncbi:YsnF/AvaK domain-containing protein [Dyadobacter sp. LJ53]|uniref:YsnF/AvaK domain-containing protein n=1 Tax=Dyadobacter chenwenxiniae TaxID=2906456 RepID=UPI001F45118E|nr:YsnF/AvaK domain-containing protein [Dyadobacter chenwenxiniae]MCF0054114.1 YsnF/AvaK domain-containing protein [Dyadobacter chenwenxiniae]